MGSLFAPTDSQRELIKSYGLNPDNWSVIRESKTDLEIVHKRCRRRVLEKRRKKNGQK